MTAPEFQPDGLASFSATGRQAGDDVYDRTGRRQTFRRVVRGRRAVRLFVPVENDGESADDIRVTASRARRRFRVSYRLAGRDVTRRVTHGGVLMRNLDPGARRTIVMTVTGRRARRGATHTFRVAATSSADPNRVDVVRLTTRRR